MPDWLTFKDLSYLAVGLVLGVPVGLVAGIAIYWWPLGQFGNEWRALWDLKRRRYVVEKTVILKRGTRLSDNKSTSLLEDTPYGVKHDVGVDWIFTRDGWQRARVVEVYELGEGKEEHFYRVPHTQISTEPYSSIGKR